MPLSVSIPILVFVPLLFVVAFCILKHFKRQKEQISKLGILTCKRYNYVGEPGSKFAVGKGMVPTCPKCNGDDWSLAEEG